MQDRIPTKSELGNAFAIWFLVVCIVIGHAMDVLTTVFAILALDAREANPVMKIFAHNPVSIAAIKYYVLRYILPPAMERARLGSPVILLWHAVIIWLAVVWNCGVIAKKRRIHARPS